MEEEILQMMEMYLGYVEKDPLDSFSQRSYLQALEVFKDTVGEAPVDLSLVQDLRLLQEKVMKLKAPDIALATHNAVIQLLRQAIPKRDMLAPTMFQTPGANLSLVQHELAHWAAPGAQLQVLSKESLLNAVPASVVAIRWLSFRNAIRTDPLPLTNLTQAVSAASAKGKRTDVGAKRQKLEAFEEEKFHYDLVELLCIHAAAGEDGVDIKRLRRAENQGEDIAILVNEKRTGIEMKRFLNKELVGTVLQKVLSLAAEMKQLLYYMLPVSGWTGRQVGALIFAHLLFFMDASFDEGKLNRLTLCPNLPTFRGSKEPLLQLYDRERLYQSSDPNVVFDTAPSDGFRGLVGLMTQMCDVNEQPLSRLRFETDEGLLLDVAVGLELVYNGRNSVVLSCSRSGDGRSSSVVKVQPEDDSRREESFHTALDGVAGIRRMESSGVVLGAGVGLRFIQLEGFGSEFGRGCMAGGEARSLAQQACDALEGMHRRSLLHRDVKPGNFVLLQDRLVLNDFDVSCDMHDTSDFSSALVGTSMFMSPRLSLGKAYKTVDDWMSLGLTLLYLRGMYRTEASKRSSLEKIATANWAPDRLKAEVAAGLLAP